MAQRVPQIVAFGGGGFSMEAGNPLLDDYVLGLTGAERPKVCFLPTASGDADHYIVRFYRHFAAACEASHVSLFRRDRCGQAGRGRHRGAPARAGPHLRRRRERREHARRLARARAGRGAAPGVAQGRGDVRALGGLAVLVRRVADGVPRRAAARARARDAPVLQLRALRRTSRSAASEYHRFVGRRDAARATRPTTARRCTSAGEGLHRVVSSRPHARAYRVEPIADEVVETPLEITYLGERVAEPAAA